MKSFAVLLVFVIILEAGIAEAGPVEECEQKENWGLRIQGCTQVIEQGGFSSRLKVWAVFVRANAHVDQGDLARAITDYDEAIRLNPQYANALYYRGHVHFIQGDFARAIADYDEAIRLNPQYSEAYNGRCWTRAVSGTDLAAGRADCDTALTLSNNEPNYLDSRGLVGIKQGQFSEAWADYDAALRAMPGTASYFYGRGIAALRLGRTGEGSADLAEATKLDANIAQIYAGYGVTPSAPASSPRK
jgi:tetratricopeptide (TPR) repeat protein